MRSIFRNSITGSSKIDGQVSQDNAANKKNQGVADRNSRPVTRINGQRIHFRDLARMAFPQKTEANLAFVARVDPRTVRRWLADHTEPPADVLGIVLAEIMKRFHQR